MDMKLASALATMARGIFQKPLHRIDCISAGQWVCDREDEIGLPFRDTISLEARRLEDRPSRWEIVQWRDPGDGPMAETKLWDGAIFTAEEMMEKFPPACLGLRLSLRGESWASVRHEDFHGTRSVPLFDDVQKRVKDGESLDKPLPVRVVRSIVPASEVEYLPPGRRAAFR